MCCMSSILNTLCAKADDDETMFSEIISVKSREENLLSCARKSFQRVLSVFNSEVVEVMMFSRYERYFRTLWAQKREEKFYTKN